MLAWYENERWTSAPRHIVSAAVVALNDEGHILLIRSPRRGWEMPGGQVELGESLEAAAIREVKEESGIDVGDLKFCGIFQRPDRSIVNTLFTGRCIGGAPQTSNESNAVDFFAPDEALRLVTYPSFRERIELCLDAARHPFFICTAPEIAV